MIQKAMQYFLDQSKASLIDIEGVKYSDKPLLPVIKKPYAKSLDMDTLSSFIDYIKSGVDEISEKMIIQVVDPTHVIMVSNLDETRQRECFAKVEARLPEFSFERFLEKENFNIALQSKFIDNKDKAVLLKFTGTIESGTLAQYSDDGISQKATIKTGIASKGDALVPNPVKLKPYRTFVEVDQPESEFIFRMQENSCGISCAIFEADGGAWRMEAMNNIKTYLKNELQEFENFIVIS